MNLVEVLSALRPLFTDPKYRSPYVQIIFIIYAYTNP